MLTSSERMNPLTFNPEVLEDIYYVSIGLLLRFIALLFFLTLYVIMLYCRCIIYVDVLFFLNQFVYLNQLFLFYSIYFS